MIRWGPRGSRWWATSALGPAAEMEEARRLYLERHENSKYWVDFDDFSFFAMDVVDVYYVGGFGVMGWITAQEYSQAQPTHWRMRLPGFCNT